jgi:YD repeat-containing protein
VTNINALGEQTVTKMDALGRTTSTLVYSASGSLVREKYFAYSADHNSVTVTDGSGASAVVNTTWTDNDGHTVLSIAYPSANTNEFTLNQFDLAGNLITAQHDSSASGTVTTWTTASQTFDGLNRPTSKSDRDNAITTYAFDPMGDLTNRTMPGGLQWQAIYKQQRRTGPARLACRHRRHRHTHEHLYVLFQRKSVCRIARHQDGRARLGQHLQLRRFAAPGFHFAHRPELHSRGHVLEL